MQLHAAALHFHCLSAPPLLTNILEGAWLFKGTFIDAAPVLADFLSEVAPAARHEEAMAKAGAVQTNSQYFQKAFKRPFLSGSPAPFSNYRILWNKMEAQCSQANLSNEE